VSNKTAEPSPNPTLLSLWHDAWEMARHACTRSMARLRHGDGGFYGVDDLKQDLFCEFWRLYLQWKAEARGDGVTPDHEVLMAQWERVLERGAWRVLRRRPQRLWTRAEQPTEPEIVERISDEAGAVDDSEAPLIADATQVEQVEQLEEAMWRLRPLQRQALYLRYWRGCSSRQIAREWRLGSSHAVDQRLFRAKRSLRGYLRQTRRDNRREK